MNFITKLISCLTIAILVLFPQNAHIATMQQWAAAEELRGLWIATVLNLDYPKSPATSAAALRAEAVYALDNAQSMGFNAIYLQVRPAMDSFYPSELFPWSAYLTGEQGQAPSDNFDPLRFWLDEAHKRGLQLHAWINPFRVTLGEKGFDGDLAALSPQNPAILHPKWVIKHDDGRVYLDPGLPEVREFVINGSVEIVRNYDVDGLHLDDYFYPDPGFDDSESYALYGGGVSRGDWRRANINDFVEKLSAAARKAHKESKINKTNKAFEFGISPAGVWANKKTRPEGSNTNGGESYSTHYADSLKWIKEGYIDYICPQIYWAIGDKNADYKTLLKWWVNAVRGTDVTLYIGMAGYRAGTGKGDSPWADASEIGRQLTLNRATPEVAGSIHFRADFYFNNKELRELITERFNYK